MKRIAVIGCPGAGKTTFSRKLAKKLSLPVEHLDFYYHQKDKDYENNREDWLNLVKKLVNEESWVIDGNYKSTFDLRFRRADTIIFFDLPRRTSMKGVIKRRIQYHNKLREEMPTEWKEKASPDFLRYVWHFKGESRDQIIEALSQVQDKQIITFKSRKQANQFLEKL